MNAAKSALDRLWPLESLTPTGDAPPGAPRPPMPRTPAETRAEETTRVAREMTDAATEKRQAQVAKLREARLAREAEEQAVAAAAPPPKKKLRKRA